MTVDKSINTKRLNHNQISAMYAVRGIARATGINIVLENKGLVRDTNGAYDPNTNTIYLDINAGKYGLNFGEYAMLRTLSHELTHYIRYNNKAAYKQLQDFIFSKLSDYKGKSIDELVAAEQYGDMNFEDAAEEVVARACEMMLRDSVAIEALYNENRGLFNTIKNFIANFKKAVYRAFDRVGARSEAAKAMLQYTDELQTLWDNALVGAVHNQQGKGTVAQGEQVKNENVDKYGFDVEKVSRANKKGELINEFYYALTKEEWNLFYKGITKGGYLARAKIGTVAPIVVKNKFIISERIRTGKNKHDYQATAIFRLDRSSEYNQVFDDVKTLMERSFEDYDEERICRSVCKFIQIYDANALLYRFDRDSRRFVMHIPAQRGYGIGGVGIHQNSQNGTSGAGFSLGNQQKVQGTSRIVKHERAEITEDEVISQSKKAMAAELTRLRELLKMQGKESHGTVFTKSSVDLVAAELIREADSRLTKAYLVIKLAVNHIFKKCSPNFY